MQQDPGQEKEDLSTPDLSCDSSVLEANAHSHKGKTPRGSERRSTRQRCAHVNVEEGQRVARDTGTNFLDNGCRKDDIHHEKRFGVVSRPKVSLTPPKSCDVKRFGGCQ